MMEERKATANGFAISDAPTESVVMILVLITPGPPPSTSGATTLYEMVTMPDAKSAQVWAMQEQTGKPDQGGLRTRY